MAALNPMRLDAEMSEKVVSNLISNALNFTWEGEIEVRVKELTQHVELTVRDTGVGIPAAELPHVLQRLHQVSRGRARSHEGVGIGLALVDELVRRSSGRIRLTSSDGVGTTCTVWLPLTRHGLDTVDTAPAATPGVVADALADEAALWARPRDGGARDGLGADAGTLGPTPPSATHDAELLIVDDNEDMRDFLSRVLGRHWRIVVANDGEQALRLARRRRPDLLLVDVMMPGKGGFTLLRAIRADPALAGLPVVLLTARADEREPVDGLAAPADDYFVKPFSSEQLVARIECQLRMVSTGPLRSPATSATSD